MKIKIKLSQTPLLQSLTTGSANKLTYLLYVNFLWIKSEGICSRVFKGHQIYIHLWSLLKKHILPVFNCLILMLAQVFLINFILCTALENRKCLLEEITQAQSLLCTISTETHATSLLLFVF